MIHATARSHSPRGCPRLYISACILLAAFHAARATTYDWDGGLVRGALDDNWLTTGNWTGGAAPVSADDTDIEFLGSAARTTSNNNVADPFTLRTLTFDAGNTAYTLSGCALNLGSGGLTQNSTAAQTINNVVNVTATQTWSFASGAGAVNLVGGLNVTPNTTLNVGAGTLNVAGNGLVVAGTFDQSGKSQVNTTSVTLPSGIHGVGNYFLQGGVLQTGSVTGGKYSMFFLDGGTLRASNDIGNLFGGGMEVALLNGGVTIDTGPHNVTLATQLQLVPQYETDPEHPGGVTKLGSGTLTGLSGFFGEVRINNGTFALPSGSGFTAGEIDLASGATLVLSGTGGLGLESLHSSGEFYVDGTLKIGDSATVTLGTGLAVGGKVIQTGGSILAGSIGFYGAGINIGSSYMMSGGKLEGAYINMDGTFKQSGGHVGTRGLGLYIGSYAASSGSYTIGASGSIDVALQNFVVGENGVGMFNQQGGTVTGSTLTLGQNSGSAGAYNLNGGVLYVDSIRGGSGESTVNFDGGTLHAGEMNNPGFPAADFISGVGALNVRAHGAVIDTDGTSVRIAQPLLHDTATLGGTPDGGLTKVGAGTLTLSGASTYTGATTIENGTVAVGDGTSVKGGNVVVDQGTLAISGTGKVEPGAGADLKVSGTAGAAGQVTLDGAGQLAVENAYIGQESEGIFDQLGGVMTAFGNLLEGIGANSHGSYLLTGTGRLSAKAAYIGYDGDGDFTQSGGVFGVQHTPNSFFLGYNAGSAGTYTLGGAGSLLSTGEAFVGRNGTGSFTQTDGRFTTNGYNLYVGGGTGTGTYTLDGGMLQTGTTIVSYGANTSIFNQTGGLHITGGLVLSGGNAASVGTYNLAGGTLQTGSIGSGLNGGMRGTGTFKFDGGTLSASQSTATFFQALTAADVELGGARIDTHEFDVTIAQPLLHDAALLGSRPDGGLTKLGAGTLTLGGHNTYTGGTLIQAGTLSATANQALGAGDVTIGAMAKLTLASGLTDAIADSAMLNLLTDGTHDAKLVLLAATGTVQEQVETLELGGVFQSPGTYGASGSGAEFIDNHYFAGTGVLLVTAIPEPDARVLLLTGALACALVALSRRRLCAATAADR